MEYYVEYFDKPVVHQWDGVSTTSPAPQVIRFTDRGELLEFAATVYLTVRILERYNEVSDWHVYKKVMAEAQEKDE